ncbi:MAG TPA: response regulator transcription factor [Planctomycetes bacterium]|nr:response regulator transcription factor [Planctomycetota bacterium]
MSCPKILIVEDDPSLRTGIKDNLEIEGYAVQTAADGGRARRLLKNERFDLIILDWMLPILSGPDLLRQLRGRGDQTPVLMLTVRNEVPDRVLGLELGADDFLGKPFALQEFLARVHALLRRGTGGPSSEPEPVPGLLSLGQVKVNLAAFRLEGESAVPLSPTEARLLHALHKRRGQVISRDRLLDLVWGPGVYVGPRTIDTHVLNLRKKLDKAGAHRDLLQTVHGAGYRLRPEEELPLTDS